jgi:general nucleoside transport system permease protein
MTAMTYEEVLVAAETRFWTRERRVGTGLLGCGALAAAGFGVLATSAPAKFTVTEDTSGAALSIGGRTGAVLFGIIAALCGIAMVVAAARWFGALLGTGIVGIVLSFLCWQISAAPTGLTFMPLVDVVRGTFLFSLPLIFGGLAGLLCERSGVVNVAIEGQLLTGAFGAALLGSIAASTWVGLIGGMLGGVLISALLAWFSIRYVVDQVVLGVVLNVLAIGLTGFIYEQIMRPYAATYNQPPRFPEWALPGLSKLPVLGPAVFTGSIFLFSALVLVVVINVALFKTRWGLRTRSVGEHPAAADTVGIKVLGLRYRNVLLAGAVAGMGGAFYTLSLIPQFSKNMISGRGFIALAALIFGRWTPTGVLLASLFFGFADKLATYLQSISSPIPSEFLAMLPYVATILAVAGLVGRVRAPAADGKPYIKG